MTDGMTDEWLQKRLHIAQKMKDEIYNILSELREQEIFTKKDHKKILSQFNNFAKTLYSRTFVLYNQRTYHKLNNKYNFICELKRWKKE